MKTIPRRTFLRGLGVTLALPYFEAHAAKGVSPPQRYAFIYTPNGYNQSAFLPETTGTGWELTPTLQPLERVRDDITLVTGLDRKFVGGTGVHAQCGSCWLTSSASEETLDGGFPTNATLDQIIAREIGTGTLLPSLELSCNDFTDNKETRYYECISWLAPGYAANVERNPRAVFQRLFGRPDGARSQSVIDVVLEDAKSLRGALGRADQGKLDEYLESVRATERRLEFAEEISGRMEKPPMAEPSGIPERRGDYLRLQAELFILAFQYDLTRVATLVVDPERWDSPRTFHDVFDKPQNHHVLTHSKDMGAKGDVAKIDRFHVEFYAHIVERLKSIREGEGSLLDSTIVSMGSGISDGDRHDYANLEVLLAGGSLKPGHFHYQDDHPLANLWLTLAQNAGVSAERFADSTGAIRDLIV
jgi:hypothetical protein